jgi:uncharacterized protein
MILGKIIGKVTTLNFKFQIDNRARKFQYVQIMHQEAGFVLAQITEIIKDPEKTIAKCNVLGYRQDNILRSLTYPLEPGTEVLEADDELIHSTLGLDGKDAYIGKLQDKELKVFLDLNKLLTKHVNILAKSGSGKSYCTGIIIEELLDKKIPTIIIDPHGEYSTLTQPNLKDKEKLLRFDIKPEHYTTQEYGIEGTEKILRLNPKNLSSQELLKILPTKLSPSQQGILYSALKNIDDNIDLQDLLFQLKTSEENSGKWALINTLEYIKKLDLFSQNPTLTSELVVPGKATIINLKGLPQEIQEIIVYKLTSDLFGDRKKGYIPPFFMVIEEAHNFLPERSLGEAKSSSILRQAAAEGRKFGMGLCIISQRPAKLDKNIISQASTQIILKVTNSLDIRALSSSIEGLTQDTEKEIPNLPIGTAMVTGVVDLPIFVDLRPRKTKHGGEAVQIYIKQDEEEKGEVMEVILPKVTKQDFEIMHNKPPKTILIPSVIITAEKNNKPYNLLVDLINLKIITNTDTCEGETLRQLKIEELSETQYRFLKMIINFGTANPSEIFEKSGLQFSELNEYLKVMVNKGYLTQDYQYSTSLQFLANLQDKQIFDTIQLTKIEGELQEPKFTLDQIKDFLGKFVDIKFIKECKLVTYT